MPDPVPNLRAIHETAPFYFGDQAAALRRWCRKPAGGAPRRGDICDAPAPRTQRYCPDYEVEIPSLGDHPFPRIRGRCHFRAEGGVCYAPREET